MSETANDDCHSGRSQVHLAPHQASSVARVLFGAARRSRRDLRAKPCDCRADVTRTFAPVSCVTSEGNVVDESNNGKSSERPKSGGLWLPNRGRCSTQSCRHRSSSALVTLVRRAVRSVRREAVALPGQCGRPAKRPTRSLDASLREFARGR